MRNYVFFDHASTTQCSLEASEKVQQYSREDYGNPSSIHAYGQKASRAIREARLFFSQHFQIQPDQIVFTGSGSEADNHALYGVALAHLAQNKNHFKETKKNRIITSAIEHPAVRKTAKSLEELGFEVIFLKSNSDGQIDTEELLEAINDQTILISLMRVNNIIGSIIDVETLAKKSKEKKPDLFFHTDCVQAFGRVEVPHAPSAIDMLSLSGHKINGPKGVGALVLLNRDLLNQKKFRPLIWGGAQENGLRSGTQHAGLISAFHIAAKATLEKKDAYYNKTLELRNLFYKRLEEKNLLENKISWNSPKNGVPHIVHLSILGIPNGPFSRLLEEKGCLVATGSACSSSSSGPDPILTAMKFRPEQIQGALRITLSDSHSPNDIEHLVDSLQSSLEKLESILRD
ncbi:MAG: hypothetical protein CL678_10240 [Bdellovibrionaceae bacterium]|nr:hypothetical protein [Pseudobdellovibrionaceae bacterium]|tara:strand:- start:368 stop:1576 length:1209 start_codon:yes stop_codon:yes gene_type:complete